MRQALLLLALFFLIKSYAQVLPTTLDNLKVKDAAARTIALDDCHFAMAGFWGGLQGSEPDSAFLMKVDPCGCVKWVETYFPLAGKRGAAFLDLVELNNGDIAAVGVVEAEETILGSTQDFQQMWTVVVDADGKVKQSKIWGLDDFPTQLLPSLYGVPASHGWAITQDVNGDILITGRALEVDATLPSSWRISSMLLRTDTLFNTIDLDFYGGQGRAELGLDLLPSVGGNIWIGGQVADSATASFYGLLRQVDASGNVLWDTLLNRSRADADGTGFWQMAERGGRLFAAGQSGPAGHRLGTDDAQLTILDISSRQVLANQAIGLPTTDEGAISIAIDDNDNIWLGGHGESTAIALKFSPSFQLIDTVLLAYPQYKSLFTSVLTLPQREEVVLGGARSRRSNTFDSLDIVFVNTGRDTMQCSAAEFLESYTGGIIIQVDDITTKVPEACLAIQTVCAPDGITPPDLAQDLVLYPNPVASGSTIHCEFGTHNPGTLRLMNMQGEIVKSAKLEGSEQTFSLPFLSPGLYIVHVETRHKRFVGKLLVQ
ncbi:MAG: T9SS type A sorting domain-containing protein [Bacteroidia bacterium]